MWVAVLGTPFLSGLEGQAEKIARIHKHPFYNGYMLDYDVALLELAAPLHYTSSIRPICLPDRTHAFSESRPCVITGWGSTKEGGTDVSDKPCPREAQLNLGPTNFSSDQVQGLPGMPWHGILQLRVEM